MAAEDTSGDIADVLAGVGSAEDAAFATLLSTLSTNAAALETAIDALSSATLSRKADMLVAGVTVAETLTNEYRDMPDSHPFKLNRLAVINTHMGSLATVAAGLEAAL